MVHGNLKKYMGKEYMGTLRTTLYLMKKAISDVIEKVKTDNHTAQILEK